MVSFFSIFELLSAIAIAGIIGYLIGYFHRSYRYRKAAAAEAVIIDDANVKIFVSPEQFKEHDSNFFGNIIKITLKDGRVINAKNCPSTRKWIEEAIKYNALSE
ncbi:MAG: hypothetical protein NZ519_13270 [Bacteroidia bacterium]|nr:hypothetical protein [Bacteroidia bacterium]MDW8302883.1 hypothetical protein [Bacteroidia bacterium]